MKPGKVGQICYKSIMSQAYTFQARTTLLEIVCRWKKFQGKNQQKTCTMKKTKKCTNIITSAIPQIIFLLLTEIFDRKFLWEIFCSTKKFKPTKTALRTRCLLSALASYIAKTHSTSTIDLPLSGRISNYNELTLSLIIMCLWWWWG